jgi:hypothetical protein
MRAAVLCLNFPAWRSRIKRAPDKGNKTRGTRMLAGDATIGNAEIVNVLKTAD